MTSEEKIAKILRADKGTIIEVERRLGKITGKTGIIDELRAQNDTAVENRLEQMKLTRKSSAKKVFDALIKKIRKDDKSLMMLMGNPDFTCKAGCDVVAKFVASVAGDTNGFFLKKEKFMEFLHKTPPKKVLMMLGYSSVDELLAKEDWREVAASLRFVEGGDWINDVLLPSYESLSPADFEHRKFEIIALNPKWENLAKNFVEKKYHNISHLKELGIIFIIPTSLNLLGELMRTVGLLFHYINEIKFYSNIFLHIGGRPVDFSRNLMSLLRGDVIDDKKLSDQGEWLIVQRYLAKNDENDWRLFVPHVNPEAMHWEKAENMLVELGNKYDDLGQEFSFWKEMNWVGDYFGTNTGVDVLVSFNLIDTSMALVQEKEMIKYLYHHQEALWNKIFSSYFGEEKMEKMMREDIEFGYIKLSEKLTQY
jgi:hypothetical protein